VIEESRNWLKILIEHIESKVRTEGYELVVIDSLTALDTLMAFENPRLEMFHFFGTLKNLRITAFLISEMTADASSYGAHYEDFLADGIFHLKFHEVGEADMQLRIKCVKLRHVKHSHGFLTLICREDGRFAVTPVISE
jgi:KaiC/GvpD/RAD55 family RecA-like ATPase